MNGKEYRGDGGLEGVGNAIPLSRYGERAQYFQSK